MVRQYSCAILALLMSETHFPPATSELDARFVFEGAYRPRASLTLAEREAFGLHDHATFFKQHLRRAPDGPVLPLPASGITSKAHCSAQVALPRYAGNKGVRGAQTDAIFPTDRWCRGTPPRSGESNAPKPVRRQLPVRFTMRQGALVLSGVIFDERIVALIRVRPERHER